MPTSALAAKSATSASLIGNRHYLTRHAEFEDASQLASALTGWNARFDQLSSGVFVGTLTEIHLDGLHLKREKINCALLKHYAPDNPFLTFCLPLASVGNGRSAGVMLDGSGILIANSRDLPEIRTATSQDIIVVAIDMRVLANLAITTGTDLTTISVNLVKSDVTRDARLAAWLLTIFSTITAKRNAEIPLPLLKTLRDAVLLELTSTVDDTKDVLRLGLSGRQKIVNCTRELLTSAPDTPLTVLDVCAAVGASRRKLQYCFEETLGIQPAVYIRVTRLNGVRRALLSADPKTSLVGDVAARWGFWHLGRFSAQYRMLFGELPSQTLAKGVK